jgi:hypothetical protein
MSVVIDNSALSHPYHRQRQLNNQNTLFSVAQKSLPAELLQAVRMVPTVKSKGKKRRLDTIAEED